MNKRIGILLCACCISGCTPETDKDFDILYIKFKKSLVDDAATRAAYDAPGNDGPPWQST